MRSTLGTGSMSQYESSTAQFNLELKNMHIISSRDQNYLRKDELRNKIVFEKIIEDYIRHYIEVKVMNKYDIELEKYDFTVLATLNDEKDKVDIRVSTHTRRYTKIINNITKEVIEDDSLPNYFRRIPIIL